MSACLKLEKRFRDEPSLLSLGFVTRDVPKVSSRLLTIVFAFLSTTELVLLDIIKEKFLSAKKSGPIAKQFPVILI